MKVLAFDQSTKVTGWSVFENAQYTDSGVIDLGKDTNTERRTKQMGLDICAMIGNHLPDCVIIENIQNQSNTATVILLARLQGIILGYCHAHNIRVEILGPSQWRAALQYQQGRSVKRAELKQQSKDFVKQNFGFKNFSEDRCEAICINEAAHKIFGWEDDIWGA